MNSKRKSFLWDNGVKGITLRQKVYSGGDVNEEKTVRIRLAIIKDEDCRKLLETSSRGSEWEHKGGNVSSAIKVDRATYQKVLDLYNKDFQDASKQIFEKMVHKVDVDYSMPVGQEEDLLTMTIPIDIRIIEPNTVYRIGIYELDAFPAYCYEWPRFDFFSLKESVKNTFVPWSAYLKVRQQIGKYLRFDKSTDYRHYKDFFSDVHFDKTCCEVEVNPALVCFELDVRCDTDNLPLFNVVLSAGDTEFYRGICRLGKVDDTNRIVVFCPLSVEDCPITDYAEITASLQVFDQTIARFPFSTNKTEQGKFQIR